MCLIFIFVTSLCLCLCVAIQNMLMENQCAGEVGEDSNQENGKWKQKVCVEIRGKGHL